MKKYHQLLLLILSLVSLTLLLIYRREYNRLHYVLEVFNFFGQQCNCTEFELSENILSHHDWGPTPLWQESEDVHIYSAFWSENSEAKAIALQANNKIIARTCYLWFEDMVKPVTGKFKSSEIGQDDQSLSSAYFYYCKLKVLGRRPYAVSFTLKSKKPSDLRKIPLASGLDHKTSFNMTICVSPSRLFSKVEFIEFLSYHKLIGIDSFIFYTTAVPHRLEKIVTNLSNRLGFKVAFFSWNFPISEIGLTREIIKNDCVLRALNESANIITLQANEYIVPAKYHSFNEVISNLKSENERFSLPVQTFCIQHTDHRKPMALQNTEVNYNNDNLVYDIVKNVNKNNYVTTQSVDKQIVSIHRYVYCSEKPQRSYHDNTILKYSTDFVRSTLVQLLLHNKL